jgi:DNA-binding transcriptional ArsR family regulator
MQPDLDVTLAAIGDPLRRAIVDLLRERPRRASDLATALSISRPAMSRHLAVLRHAGIVAQELLDSDARVRMVQLQPEPFAQLRGWLGEVEAFWGDQLAAFKAHAERGARARRS